MRPLLFSQPRRGLASANVAPAKPGRRVSNQARLRAGERTRGFGAPGDVEDVTVATDAAVHDAGVRDAGLREGGGAGVPPGALPGAAIAAGAAGPGPHCRVHSGPTHTPSGNIPVTNAGGRKTANFALSAVFRTTQASNEQPGCCSVRQYIMWDQRYATSRGGPPHSGFPASTPPGTFVEDRDQVGGRYGHRSGPHSQPRAGCEDEYLLAGSRNMLHGDSYCGTDGPNAHSSRLGTWQFYLTVEDTCAAAAPVRSPTITLFWG
jgi:hypothetical protein